MSSLESSPSASDAVLIVDANVLIYATDRTSPAHAHCRSWLEDALGGAEVVGFSWAVLLAFVRLTTRAQLFERPLSASQALDVVDEWLRQPTSVIAHPTDRHAGLLRSLLEQAGTAGNLTSDAHLAALAIEHGATLVSCDNDFARFSGLRWLNPRAV